MGATTLHGVSASPGIVVGPAHLLRWEVPEVRSRVIEDGEIDAEIARLRAAIDAAVAATPWQLTEAEREELELTFSRGFSPGWLEGCDHKRLVPGVSSAKRGRLIGTVRRVRGQRVEGEPVSFTHLRAHETVLDLVFRLLLEKKKKHIQQYAYINCAHTYRKTVDRVVTMVVNTQD